MACAGVSTAACKTNHSLSALAPRRVAVRSRGDPGKKPRATRAGSCSVPRRVRARKGFIVVVGSMRMSITEQGVDLSCDTDARARGRLFDSIRSAALALAPTARPVENGLA
jgi:hypothetical protein